MTDSFRVPVSSTDLVTEHRFTEQLAHETQSVDRVPVLFDDRVFYFHEITGGYNQRTDQLLVTLVHTVQGDGSPPNDPTAGSVEVHAPDHYYRMQVTDMTHWGDDYPESDYCITCHVDTSLHSSGRYTFFDELLADCPQTVEEVSYFE